MVKLNNALLKTILLDEVLPNFLIKKLEFTTLTDNFNVSSCSFKEIIDLGLISQVWKLVAETKKDIIFFKIPQLEGQFFIINSVRVKEEIIIILCQLNQKVIGVSKKAKVKAEKRIMKFLKLEDVSKVSWIGEA